MGLVAGCTVAIEPWQPPPESPEAQQAWQKAKLANQKDQWQFIESQFVEWGLIPPDPPKPSLGGNDFNAGEVPRPQQALMQQEEDPETETPANWSPLSRRQLFIYVQKPVRQGPWSRFQLGWLARTKEQWSKRLELNAPMRVRCEGAKPAGVEVLESDQFRPLAINAGLDGSENGSANLQALLPELTAWICRQREATAQEALKPLVVER